MGGKASTQQTDKVAEVQAKIDALNADYAELNSQLKEKKVQVEEYQKQVESLNERLETELQKANVTIQDLQNSNDVLARQVLSLRNDIDAMRVEFQKDREETQKWLKSLQRQNITIGLLYNIDYLQLISSANVNYW